MSRRQNPYGDEVEALARDVARQDKIPLPEARSRVRAMIQKARSGHDVTALDRPARRQMNPVPQEPPPAEKARLSALSDAELADLYAKDAAKLGTGRPTARDSASRRVCWYLWVAERRGLDLDRRSNLVKEHAMPRAKNPTMFPPPKGTYLVRRYDETGTGLQGETIMKKKPGETDEDMLLRLARGMKNRHVAEVDDGQGKSRRLRIVREKGRVGYEPIAATGRAHNPAMTFKSLAVGDVFEFDRSGLTPGAALAHGPWRKVSARQYVKVSDPSLKHTVGTVSARVVQPGRASNPAVPQRTVLAEWTSGGHRLECVEEADGTFSVIEYTDGRLTGASYNLPTAAAARAKAEERAREAKVEGIAYEPKRHPYPAPSGKSAAGASPAALKRLGLSMANWHASMGDPIYAAGSHFVSGERHPSLETERDALRSLERLLSEGEDPKIRKQYGWKPKDIAELRRTVKELRALVGEEERKENPARRRTMYIVMGFDGHPSGRDLLPSATPHRIHQPMPSESQAIELAVSFMSANPPVGPGAGVVVEEKMADGTPFTVAKWEAKGHVWDESYRRGPIAKAPRRPRASKAASSRTTLNEAEKAMIRQIVGRLHVAEDDEKVREFVRSKLKHPESPLSVAAQKYAVEAHHKNIALYNDVMSGQVGRSSKKKSPPALPPARSSERAEMEELLEQHGYPRSAAEKLLSEGIGPFELASRLRVPAGEVGSLEYTHRIHRSRSSNPVQGWKY